MKRIQATVKATVTGLVDTSDITTEEGESLEHAITRLLNDDPDAIVWDFEGIDEFLGFKIDDEDEDEDDYDDDYEYE